MKTLRRFTTGKLSSFEAVVGQLENHEALVSSAIRDAEEAVGRAKAQYSRVVKDGALMRQKVVDLRQQAEIYEDRAKRCAALDEKKALECVRRRERIRKQVAELDGQVLAHSKLEKQLAADLSTVQDKLSSLRQQRNILRTRQSRAEALRLVQGVDSGTIREIDDIFDRWEAKIGACENHSAQVTTTAEDLLSEEFQSAEEEEDLKKLLGELTGKA